MNFLIADTFQSSLARLTGAEQKAAKTAAFDLRRDPAGEGKSFHRLDRVRDPNFWFVRVNDDPRLIVRRGPGLAAARLCRPPRPKTTPTRGAWP